MAITVPVITSALERRRLRWEGEQRRFDELRSLLDLAVARLSDARNLLYDAMQESGRGDVERVRQMADGFRQMSSEVFKDNLRIVLRLGERSAIAQAHTQASAACSGLEVELDQYLRKPEGPLMLNGFSGLGDEIAEVMEQARGLIGVKT